MSMYGVGDFAETLRSEPLESPPTRVIAAWGEGSGMGEWDEAADRLSYAPSDWSGGFLLELVNGRFAYVTGWNDYTGWGCQDGAEVTYYDAEPDRESLGEALGGWDEAPADLSRWIAAGMPDLYSADFRERMRGADL